MNKKTNLGLNINYTNTNASEMIYKISNKYLELCDTLEKKKVCLDLACTAWNISSLPDEEIEKKILSYVSNIKVLNKRITEEHIEGIHSNIRLLIREKLKLYPNDNRVMMFPEIIIIKGKQHLRIASINSDSIKRHS